MGKRPGDTTQACFQLPSHAEQNLTPAQSAEIIAEHFCHISQQFDPLHIPHLPPNVQEYLSQPSPNHVPKLSNQEVYKRIMEAKKTNSQVPGDLPSKLVKQFANLLTGPVTTIFNKVSASASYPTQWKIEHQLPLPKVSLPESEDDLRNIAKTPFWSKVYESFIGSWLIPIIQP